MIIIYSVENNNWRNIYLYSKIMVGTQRFNGYFCNLINDKIIAIPYYSIIVNRDRVNYFIIIY